MDGFVVSLCVKYSGSQNTVCSQTPCPAVCGRPIGRNTGLARLSVRPSVRPVLPPPNSKTKSRIEGSQSA